MNQLELHKKIEEFFKAGLESADVKVAQSFFINEDAKRFFFSLADQFWLDWLWQNGFLDEIKNKAKDPTMYVFSRLSELDYLVKMAEKDPSGLTKIMVSDELVTKEEKFNPEVVDRFLWIINALPAEQIKKLTEKICDEKWIYLMRKFNKSGYEFTKIIEKLAEKKESESLLQFAQAILAIKNKTEVLKEGNNFSVDESFCVNYLSASGIFDALANIEESYAKKALEITTGIMSEIVKLAEPDSGKVFDYTDLFSLYDIDFFTLEIEKERGHSYREDVKNLAATIKKLIERTIGKKCNDANEAKRLFGYIDNLPSCRSMWRLRLFALTQCPDVFREELNKSFLRIFEVGDRYFDIDDGAEYHQTLIRAFSVLDPKTEQREYIRNVFDYFGAQLGDKNMEEWRRQHGLKILSFIKEHLTPGEKNEAKEKFGHSLEGLNFTPEPSIGKVKFGFVSPKTPAEVGSYTIEQIVLNLKSEWAPEKLDQQAKARGDDFWGSRGAEGLGNALKEDIKKRTDEYLKNINSFFDRKEIHSHYVYSLLRSIEEMLRNKQSLRNDQISQLFGLFEIIRDEGEKTPFKRKDDKSWLVDWIEVHKLITDILLYILENKETRESVHKAYREKIKNLISYLFTIKDSPSKEHEKPEYGEPYHIAINSVRGRAYEAFVVFTENEGNVLTDYSKELYKKALADDSLAVRFVTGRYLSSFYFRGKDFITGLLPDIFPKNEPGKKDIYLATWEGYLSSALYDKLFTELKDYYEYAIRFDPKDYTQRKYSKGLDESLAIHLALAFIHLGVGFDNELFKLFWSTKNITRQHEFVSFIGRSVFTRSQAGNDWLKENNVSKEKLIKFWGRILENKEITEPKVFSGFGFWINESKEIIDDKIVIKNIAHSLKKSEGEIDWDYGLLRRLKIFAEKMPDETIDIIKNFLLGKDGNLSKHRHTPFFAVNNEIKDALKIIYAKGDAELNKKIVSLINTLIEKGSSIFWGLKEVIKEK